MSKELYLRLCAALWGLAIGISLLPFWERPAPADQMPGYMKAIGIDAHASFRFALGLMILPVLVAWLSRRATDLLARDDTRAWARNAFAGAAVISIWYVLNDRKPLIVVAVPLVVLTGACVLRRFRARFSRGDMILVPTVMAVYIALLDLMPKAVHDVMLTAIVLVFAVRIAVVRLSRPYLAFTLSPLALTLQTHFLGYRQRHMPWLPLLIALLLPLVIALCIGRLQPAGGLKPAATRGILTFVVYPLAAYSYVSAISLLAAEGMPHADLFEDSHNLLAASQMLRGEKLYTDIIPSHGMIHDGLLPYAALRTGSVDLGRVLKVRGVVGALNAVANYAIAACATGSPETGIAAVFLGMMLGTATGSPRMLPALVTLALIAYALRRRDPRWMAVAGVAVVLSILTSLDFGLFALLIILIATLRFDDKRRALAYTAIGGIGAALVAFIVLGIAGIAGAFVRVTLFEIAPLAAAYALPPFTTPPALGPIHNVPEVVAALFDKSLYLIVVWPVVAIAAAAALARRKRGVTPRRWARDEAVLVVATFMVIAGLSYAERHHPYWQFALAPLVAAAIFRLSRSRARALVPAAVIAALMAAQPTQHIAIAGGLRRTHGVMGEGWRELGLPRAQGALISDRDAAVIDAVYRYAQPRLAEGETFFDFSNRNLLYFLLDRDCPIRQPEVAFYETEALQREVIARLEANKGVRFAIVAKGVDSAAVDAVPSATRAPLVWEWIQRNCTLDHEEAGVEFWIRNSG